MDSSAPDFESIALITIDTQRDTLDGQPFEIPGTSAALPRMQRLLRLFRRQGKPIVHIVRLYHPDGSNAELCRRDFAVRGLTLPFVPATGCNYPNCPRSSIYEASERDYRIVLVDDAVSNLDDRGRGEMRNIGVVLLATEALEARADVVSTSPSAQAAGDRDGKSREG